MTKNKFLKAFVILITVLLLAAIAVFSVAVNRGLITVDSVYRDPIISAVRDSEFSVCFLDVGHSDCTYIKYGDCDILIDFGNSESYTHIEDMLKRCGAEDLELVVVSDPEQDNLEKFINNYKIDKLLTYSETFEYGELSIKSVSSDIVKVNFKNTDFLFTGDISQKAEREILEQGADISADVIKIANHGSNRASGEEFLKAVNPAIAVISTGENYFDQPSASVLERLTSLKIPYYRTDLSGDIVITSDGETLTVITSKT